MPDGLNLGFTGLNADLEEMVRAKERPDKPVRWPWEMPLRGLRHHREGLKSVTLVCSELSLPQARLFANLVAGYFVSGPKVRVLFDVGGELHLAPCPLTPDPSGDFDFEDFDQLSVGLIWLFAKLQSEGIAERQIMVDVTGGQKPTSIVAAAVTFNRAVEAQYVQTDDPYQVLGYDMFLTHSEPSLS